MEKFRVYTTKDDELDEPTAWIIDADSLEAAQKFVAEREGPRLEIDDVPFGVVPMCPECEADLTSVTFRDAGSLGINKYGDYEDGGQTSGEYICGECGKTIGGYGQQTWGFHPNLV